MQESPIYEIRIEGILSQCWSAWFEGLAISSDANLETTLSGPFVDQAALFGVLNKIHALNLVLISVYRAPANWHDNDCSVTGRITPTD